MLRYCDLDNRQQVCIQSIEVSFSSHQPQRRINLPLITQEQNTNMETVHMTDDEIKENTIWSTNRLYLRLLETFPKYVEDFQAKWNDWQEVISAQEYGP